jgi:hypothetical protein
MNRRAGDRRVAPLLHVLWTKAVGTVGYVKREWQALATWVHACDRRKKDRRR